MPTLLIAYESYSTTDLVRMIKEITDELSQRQIPSTDTSENKGGIRPTHPNPNL